MQTDCEFLLVFVDAFSRFHRMLFGMDERESAPRSYCTWWGGPEDWPFAGVYFLMIPGYIKIGSSKNVLERVEDYCLPVRPEPLGWIRTDPVERCAHEIAIHKALKAYRARSEWFVDCPALRAFIAKYAKPWPA